jgi:hypothetical protein
VYDTLATAGIGIYLPQFKWEKFEYYGHTLSRLTCKLDSRTFYFSFHCSVDGKWSCEYFPGKENRTFSSSFSSWTEMLSHLGRWAMVMKQELDCPDPWYELGRLQSGFAVATASELANDPFTVPEAKVLSERLRALEERIAASFARNKDDLKVIRSKLEYLISAMERQGKQDWLHTSIGDFATMAMSLGVSAANTDSFWAIVREVFGTPFRLLSGM